MKKPRISLKVALLLIAVLCVLLGKVSMEARRQKAAVEWVTKNGGVVLYDWQYDKEERRRTKPWYRQWAADYLGKDYVQTANFVTFVNDPIADVSPLIRLDGLKYLMLMNANVEDITPLASLRHLEVLNIMRNRVTDISAVAQLPRLRVFHGEDNQIKELDPLFGLPALEKVYVILNPIENAELAELRKRQPNCRIYPRARPTVFERLNSLGGLGK